MDKIVRMFMLEGIVDCMSVFAPYIKSTILSSYIFINALSMLVDFGPITFTFDGTSLGPVYACYPVNDNVREEFRTYLDKLFGDVEEFDPLRNVKIPTNAKAEDLSKAIVDSFIEEVRRFGYNDIASVFESERKEFMKRLTKLIECRSCDPEKYLEKYFRLINIVKIRYVSDGLAKKYLVIGDISKGIFLVLLNAGKAGFYEFPNDGVKFLQLIASLFPDMYRISYGVDPRGYAYNIKILTRIKDDTDAVNYFMNTFINEKLGRFGMSLDDLLTCMPENMRNEAKALLRTDDIAFLSTVVSAIASIDYGYTVLMVPYGNSTMYIEMPRMELPAEAGRLALCMYTLVNLLVKKL